MEFVKLKGLKAGHRGVGIGQQSTAISHQINWRF